jgi:hypothetical protein
MTRRGNIVLTKVSELIDQDGRSWDEELIREIFWAGDAERILKIPLAVGMMDDFVSWHHNKNGLFTVRSAYFLEWDHQHGRKLRRTQGSTTSSINPLWKTIWSLRVPAKIKIHVWRAVWGAIPCFGVLANRHIPISSQCPICSIDCESIPHAFFKCSRAKEVWKGLGMLPLINKAVAQE